MIKKPENYSGIVQFVNGTKIWYKNGKTHREDGPAWIDLNHFKRWTLEDNLIWNSDYKLDQDNQLLLESKEMYIVSKTISIKKQIVNKKWSDKELKNTYREGMSWESLHKETGISLGFIRKYKSNWLC